MSFRTLMIIKSIVCLVFAPIMLFAPGWLLTLMGAGYGGGAPLTAREYGASLVGNMLLAWLGRNVIDSLARRAITWNLFIYDAVGMIATLYILGTGAINFLGWGVVAVYLFFTIGFGYYALFVRKVQPAV